MSRLMESILRTHEERRSARVADADGDDERDMLDVLLRIQKEADMPISITHGVIREVLKDIFGAGLDTTMITLRWTMAELMANPRVMQKAQSEIRRVLAGEATVHDAALNDLHYLRAVIKETLRLHPPGPLVPRMCLQDCKIQEYVVPQGAIVLTNVWAISRDPKYWYQPEKFMPERFEADSVADFRGTNFEFTPFGVERRICPGIGFANANIEIALASLLYHYDWELPAGVKPEEVDMTEVFGATVTKKADLYLHSLDEATQRTEETSSMGGFVWALSIWMWERLPVGRPEKLPRRPWDSYGEDGDSARYPTVAYKWDVVHLYTATSKAAYKAFTNEMDALTPSQVNWWPYHDRERGFEMNVMCEQDRVLWRCMVPMICVYAVEWHLPHRVAAQFGIYQHTPPGMPNDTGGHELHLKSRKNNQSITDWERSIKLL